MKDLITILVCNAIRQAEQVAMEKCEPLSDAEVMSLAVHTQMSYHQSELSRFMQHLKANVSAQAPKPRPQLRAVVTPPKDLHAAARKELGNDYDGFIAEYGSEFTPKNLVDYIEGR